LRQEVLVHPYLLVQQAALPVLLFLLLRLVERELLLLHLVGQELLLLHLAVRELLWVLLLAGQELLCLCPRQQAVQRLL
jgi:hypothetical protein